METVLGVLVLKETYIGGKRPGKRGRGAAGKTIVAGMVERGGQAVVKVVPDVKAKTLLPMILEHVPAGPSWGQQWGLRSVPGLAPGPRRRGLKAPQRRADPPRRAVQLHVVGQVRRLEAPPAASAQVHRPHLRIDPAPASLPSWGPPFSRLS